MRSRLRTDRGLPVEAGAILLHDPQPMRRLPSVHPNCARHDVVAERDDQPDEEWRAARLKPVGSSSRERRQHVTDDGKQHQVDQRWPQPQAHTTGFMADSLDSLYPCGLPL